MTPETGETVQGLQILPGREAILYSAGTPGDWNKSKVYVQALKPESARQLLIDGGWDARYVHTGHIVYSYQSTLFAVPFDLGSLKVAGGPAPAVEGVRGNTANSGSAQFSFSSNGNLVYIPGDTSAEGGTQRTITYLDLKSATLERLKLEPKAYAYPRVSPNGKRVAVVTEGETQNVWIIDLTGAAAPRQLTTAGKNSDAIWSSDGQRITFASDREGAQAIFWQKADGTGAAERLTKPAAGSRHFPQSWSADGKHLIYIVGSGAQGVSLSILSLQDQKSSVLVESTNSTRKLAVEATFSPDGMWFAYMSNETGTNQVFVQPFPQTGAKYVVARGGQSLWSRDGKELYFNPAQGKIAVVAITTRPTFSFGEPVIFSNGGLPSRHPTNSEVTWDIMPDGKRLIGTVDASSDASTAPGTAEAPALRIEVVLNWFTDLKQRVSLK